MSEIEIQLTAPARAGDTLVLDLATSRARPKRRPAPVPPPDGRWWQYAVCRGEGIPSELDGVWYDLGPPGVIGMVLPETGPVATLEPTNRWEQRDDGAVAVVYEWTRRR